MIFSLFQFKDFQSKDFQSKDVQSKDVQSKDFQSNDIQSKINSYKIFFSKCFQSEDKSIFIIHLNNYMVGQWYGPDKIKCCLGKCFSSLCRILEEKKVSDETTIGAQHETSQESVMKTTTETSCMKTFLLLIYSRSCSTLAFTLQSNM